MAFRALSLLLPEKADHVDLRRSPGAGGETGEVSADDRGIGGSDVHGWYSYYRGEEGCGEVEEAGEGMTPPPPVEKQVDVEMEKVNRAVSAKKTAGRSTSEKRIRANSRRIPGEASLTQRGGNCIVCLAGHRFC